MKLKLFSLIVGLQVAWVLCTVAVQEQQLARAVTVLLETETTSPGNLWRDGYLRLNYKVSHVPVSLFQPTRTNKPPVGTTVFVLLEKRGEFHEAVSASLEQPKPAEGQVLLRGTVEHGRGTSNDQTVTIRYGLERYYVREGTGNPRGKLTVQAAVNASGRALIKQVFIDGKSYAEVMEKAP